MGQSQVAAKQYLDDQGNPTTLPAEATGKVYLDDQGNDIQPVVSAKPESILARLGNLGIGALKAGGEFLGGAQQGVAEMGARLGQFAPGPTGEAFKAQLANQQVPGPGAGLAGYSVAKAAPYFLPNAVIPRAAGLIPRALQEGAETTAVNAIDTGRMEEAAKYGGLTSALVVSMGGMGKLLKMAGKKIQTSTIKGTIADSTHGYKAENIFKHDVGGSLETALNKTDAKLRTLKQMRDKLLDPSIEIDMNKVFNEAAHEVGVEVAKGKMIGMDEAVLKELQRLKASVDTVSPTGVVNIKQAENIKESLGDLGAWLYGRPEIDAAAKERIANMLYMKVMKEIEGATLPGNVRALNQQMKELIPIKQAIIKRIPVAERSNILSLGDITTLLPAMLTGDAKTLAFYVAQKGSKMGSVGWFLYKHGEKPSEMLGTIAGKGIAALSSIGTGKTYDWTPDGGLVPVEQPPQ